jgi:hypothetical protein
MAFLCSLLFTGNGNKHYDMTIFVLYRQYIVNE